MTIQAPKTNLFVRNASELCVPDPVGPGVERHAGWGLYIEGGRVRWVGPERDAPQEAHQAPVYDAEQRAVLPALIDSHTHLIYGGDRTEDFARRAGGQTYTEIAAQGGGIQTTVRATRAAAPVDLASRARKALARRAELGIATTEIKSGYGLETGAEIKILEIIAELMREGYDVEATFLGAHTIPVDVERSRYIQVLVEEMLPRVAEAKLARFCDVFVETGAFTIPEARTIFAHARAHGLIPRAHVDQLSAGGGAELSAEVGAASADHLEYVSAAGIKAMATHNVVATLLPGALFYLGDTCPGLGRRLIDGGVEVAVATDANPGSSPTHNLPLMATLAVTHFGLRVEEALRAITLGAAHGLRRTDIGGFSPGQRGRFIVIDDRDARALVASYGEPIVLALVDSSR
ncbi:MAG: imidazolonepropionase [Deltaproteobacteria bacterium]|nr:imidazolonepropionase [Deltaproteobacteria bacterium]